MTRKRQKTKNYSRSLFLRLTEEEYGVIQLIKDRETRTRRKFIVEAIREKVNKEKIL